MTTMVETSLNFKTELLKTCCVCGSASFRAFDEAAALLECTQCTFVFASPRPTLAELEKYYSKPTKYDDWVKNETERDNLWKRRLNKMKKHSVPGSLLDIGSGIGQLLGHAKPFFSEVFGTEISSSGIELAQKKYGVHVYQGTLSSIEFNRTFDNISLFHVLEHVHDPRQLLLRCRELLNPGARLFIAVPNDLRNWELQLRTWLKKKKNTETTRTGIPRIKLDGTVDEIHLSQFTVETLSRLLKECKFDIVNESLDPFFAKSGKKLAAFQFLYAFHSIIHALFHINRYNTIWMVATPR